MEPSLNDIYEAIVDTKVGMGKLEVRMGTVEGTVNKLSDQIGCLQTYRAEQEGAQKQIQPWKRAFISWVVPTLFSVLIAGIVALTMVKTTTIQSQAKEVHNDTRGSSPIK